MKWNVVTSNDASYFLIKNQETIEMWNVKCEMQNKKKVLMTQLVFNSSIADVYWMCICFQFNQWMEICFIYSWIKKIRDETRWDKKDERIKTERYIE